MSRLSVSVAAYGAFAPAAADWDDLDRAVAARAIDLIDAALVERDDTKVVRFHRYSAAAWGRGLIASAVVGLVSPPALLVGAVAGSVGGNMITVLSQGLSREGLCEFGRVMEAGPFVTVALADRGGTGSSFMFGDRSLALASLPVGGTALALRAALEADADDA
jgi:hypothetical protein